MLLLAALFVSQAGAQTVPVLHQHVTDLTRTLDTSQIAELEARLAALEQRKGSQIAVLMVPTTEGQAIEEYAIAVAEKNRLGRKEIDDGLLLLIAKDDRKARIEVGYGLEGVVPDAIASRVIREYLTPHFRQGDYFGGIKESLDVLIGLVEGEPLPAPMVADEKSGPPLLIVAVFLGFFIGSVGAATGIKPITLRRAGAASVAIGAMWLIFGLSFLVLIAGFIAFLSANASSGGYGSGRSGWGSLGGGGWSGRSGGGGWSGGGGSFGGGGASGGW